MMVTWNDIRVGDRITDDDGGTWEVMSARRLVFREEQRFIGPAREDEMPTRIDVTILARENESPGSITMGVDPMALVERSHLAQPVLDAALNHNIAAEELNDTYSQEQEVAQVEDAFGDDKVELIASETAAEAKAREAATTTEPLVLPVITSPLSLRSHLYLVHGQYVGDLDPGPAVGAALLHHHQQAHEVGPMNHPHVHEEDK
jgi:hypothetical protein